MAENNWPCFVGAYEIRRASDLPDEVEWISAKRQRALKEGLYKRFPKERDDYFASLERELTAPHLVQIAPSRREVPKREVWDMAVLRLLRTKLPPGRHLSRKQSLQVIAQMVRLNLSQLHDADHELRNKKTKETKLDYSDIAQSALAISPYLGLLSNLDDEDDEGRDDIKNEPPHESLENWVRCADEIQAMFFGREVGTGLPENLIAMVGTLNVVLSYGPDGVSMQLLPADTGDALVYHAAQMVTNGTKLLNCEYCHSPFLSGGETRGRGKRRSDARFCSDECRWKHHNEVRSKAKRKKKS